jgi:hypothetical protein
MAYSDTRPSLCDLHAGAGPVPPGQAALVCLLLLSRSTKVLLVAELHELHGNGGRALEGVCVCACARGYVCACVRVCARACVRVFEVGRICTRGRADSSAGISRRLRRMDGAAPKPRSDAPAKASTRCNMLLNV